MSEVPDAFGRFERSNERANASPEPLDCSLRSLTQQRLQRMEYQFYRIKVRGIRWQIAQAGAARLDDLLHTRDFMEGDVIDHYNVAALERWDQTLLKVGQMLCS